MKKILIIDDDADLGRLLSDYLQSEGFDCLCLYDGPSGQAALCAGPGDFDLAILDVMLPGKSGLDVLAEVRRAGHKTPIIMLTAKGDPIDLILGLEMGADDYLPKPFNPRELLARIRSVLRRASSAGDDDGGDRLRLDGFELSEKSLQGLYQGRPLNLTVVEFKVLWLLLSTPGQIAPRRLLYKEALGRRGQPFDRSLDMHISHLRKKIWPSGDAGLEKIKSVRGEGYVYIPESGRLR